MVVETQTRCESEGDEVTVDLDSDDDMVDHCMQLRYTRENVKILKHDKDICLTNKPSARSEVVKDKSLDEVIAERKIIAPASKWNKEKDGIGKHRPKFQDVDDPNLDNKVDKRRQKFGSISIDLKSCEDISLDEIIKKNQPSKQSNVSKLGQSLDEIIQGPKRKNGINNGNGERQPERGGEKRRRTAEEMVFDEDYEHIMSGIEVVEKLTKHSGFIVQHEIAKQTDHTLGQSHNWRAVAKCGEVSVTVDGSFKELSRQAAAYELIKTLKELDPKHFYPKCCIPDAHFYDNLVFVKLDEACAELGLTDVRFETRQRKRNGMDVFTTTYFIGDDEFTGTSTNQDHSQLYAAKGAYETYSQKKCPRGKYHVMENYKTGKVECLESSAAHSITIGMNVLAGLLMPGIENLEPDCTDGEDR